MKYLLASLFIIIFSCPMSYGDEEICPGSADGTYYLLGAESPTDNPYLRKNDKIQAPATFCYVHQSGVPGGGKPEYWIYDTRLHGWWKPKNGDNSSTKTLDCYYDDGEYRNCYYCDDAENCWGADTAKTTAARVILACEIGYTLNTNGGVTGSNSYYINSCDRCPRGHYCQKDADYTESVSGSKTGLYRVSADNPSVTYSSTQSKYTLLFRTMPAQQCPDDYPNSELGATKIEKCYKITDICTGDAQIPDQSTEYYCDASVNPRLCDQPLPSCACITNAFHPENINSNCYCAAGRYLKHEYVVSNNNSTGSGIIESSTNSNKYDSKSQYCESCPAGYYCPADTNEKRPCPAGTTSKKESQSLTDCFLQGGVTSFKDSSDQSFTIPAGVNIHVYIYK